MKTEKSRLTRAEFVKAGIIFTAGGIIAATKLLEDKYILNYQGDMQDVSTLEPVPYPSPKPEKNTNNSFVEPGEIRSFKHYTFFNLFPGYLVSLEDKALEKEAIKYGISLYDSKNLNISLDSSRSYSRDNILDFTYLRIAKEKERVDVGIAGGYFKMQVENSNPIPPEREIELYYSLVVSSSIFLAHCDLAQKNGEIDKANIRTKTSEYLSSLMYEGNLNYIARLININRFRNKYFEHT